MSRAMRPLGPLDHVLIRLIVHGLPQSVDLGRFDTWLSACPVCRVPTWCLRIREAGRRGPVSFTCTAGRCEDGEVRAALAAEPTGARIADLECRLQLALAAAETATAIADRALDIAAAVTLEPQRAAA